MCALDLFGAELDRWRVVMSTVMKLSISIKGEKLLGR